MRRLATFVLLLANGFAFPVQANDSVAEIGAGGLVLGRSQSITMEKERLYLSLDEVQVDYVFRNNDSDAVKTIVAFPMPDITFSQESDLSIPKEGDNFLGFSVEADGTPITPQLQQRAWAAGVDVTDLVLEAGLKVIPAGGQYEEFTVPAASAGAADKLLAFGAITPVYGSDKFTATWTVRSAYWWEMEFPGKADIEVSHTYTPASGGSAGLYALTADDDAVLEGYRKDYCVDDGFVSAVRKANDKAQAEKGYGYTEGWLDYVLTTGANWNGPIGELHVIVDKGDPGNFVSFCAEGVTKTGPTTFEFTYNDYWPEQDLKILYALKPQE